MEQNAKAQAIERIKEAQNVLVTVSANPSVDQLAAAIGFTLLLNKLDKHATAVFSGNVPSTLEFLKPEDTLEQTTDSLRDFIISLDKSKADKLRYKVEDEVVRIFITPYRTHLSENDLIFSQGDFNVDAVVALGVASKDHIDAAIVAHGRILHDATVISLMAGADLSDVGSINWQDPNASSLCEMLMNISESLKSGIVDNQIATAFLTGIVAATDRFKNEKTTPKVMTMSAQLMAAGANQQLIAKELAPPPPPPPVFMPVKAPDDDSKDNKDGKDDDDDKNPPNDDGEGVISLHHYGDHDHQEDKKSIEDHHVSINEDGEFANADQLREGVDQVEQHRYNLKDHNRNIAPIEHDTNKKDDFAALVQSDDEAKAEEEPLEDVHTPLPGEQIHPADEPARLNYDDNITLPPPEIPTELPQISHDRWGKEAKFLDHPPTTDASATDFDVPDDQDSDLPSIEQAGEQNYSKYMTSAPIIETPLNATDGAFEREQIDPLVGIPQAGPFSGSEATSTESPFLTTQHDAESPLASDVPSTEHPRLSDDGESDINPVTRRPLGPEIDDSDTLSEIENSVENYEQSGQQPASDNAEDQARQAVMNAINQADPSPYQAPNQNIGAQFVPLDLQPQTVVTDEPPAATTPNMPPTVPPPIFPMPGIAPVDVNAPIQNQQQ